MPAYIAIKIGDREWMLLFLPISAIEEREVHIWYDHCAYRGRQSHTIGMSIRGIDELPDLDLHDNYIGIEISALPDEYKATSIRLPGGWFWTFPPEQYIFPHFLIKAFWPIILGLVYYWLISKCI